MKMYYIYYCFLFVLIIKAVINVVVVVLVGDVFKRRITQCLLTIVCICIEQVKLGVFAG